jgi:hypothetical protein
MNVLDFDIIDNDDIEVFDLFQSNGLPRHLSPAKLLLRYQLQCAVQEKKLIVQSDQKENKSEQVLQIVGQFVAEFYAKERSMHGRKQFVVSNATL